MRMRRLRQTRIVSEDDFETFEQRRATEFHPHCYLPVIAVAEARIYDDTLALAHRYPAYGEQD
jgi:hypothetical protein